MHKFPTQGPGVMVNATRWGRNLEVLFYQADAGKMYVAEPLQYHLTVEEGANFQATTALDPIMAQQLMD